MKNCIACIKPYFDQIEKPQRYLGGELHQVKKDWRSVRCRFLFGFPDIYDVGMSSLGLSILYEAVNRRPGLLMERAFSPWADMEAVMVREGIPLYGLESGRPAGDFDCIGFTLQHEMSYTNVLQMLQLSGIPFWAEERGADQPVVIAGGPCAANAEPLAPFLDAVVLGEGEEILPALLEAIAAHKEKRGGRADKPVLLAELSALPGVYVPSGISGIGAGSTRRDAAPAGGLAPVRIDAIQTGGLAPERIAAIQAGVLEPAQIDAVSMRGLEPPIVAIIPTGGAEPPSVSANQDSQATSQTTLPSDITLDEKSSDIEDRSSVTEESSSAGFAGNPARERGSVRKAWLPSLEGAVFPLKPIVPYMEIIHDRMMLEILRGCTRGCRFCQAGMIYRPVRERSRATLLAQAKTLRDSTGHREISLTSLSSSDHTCIKEIVEDMAAEFYQGRIGISLPSLRANHFSVGLAQEIQKVRKTGLTFAPEAGSQSLRDRINKGVDEESFLSTVATAVSAGWRQIKLYFMIGLPGETMEDIDAIARLCEKVIQAGDRVMRENGLKGWLQIACAVSSFVPKAQTPFQWLGQASQEELKEKQARLKQQIRNRRISLSYHDAFTSMLEAIFARGGRELAPVLVSALEKGCRFDSWTERLRRDSWREAFEEAGMDMESLAARRFDLDAPLPWDHLDYGVSKAFLRKEYEKSLRGETTGDCRYQGCAGCGVCDAYGALRRDTGEGEGEVESGGDAFHGDTGGKAEGDSFGFFDRDSMKNGEGSGGGKRRGHADSSCGSMGDEAEISRMGEARHIRGNVLFGEAVDQ